MPTCTCEARAIGHTAYNVLSRDQRGTVIGKTSCGVFIRMSGRWVIFVSFEDYRGPLTVTLDERGVDLLRAVPTCSIAQVSARRLVFHSVPLVISAGEEAVWHGRVGSDATRPVSERTHVLERLATRVLDHSPEVGFSGMLPFLLGLPPARHELRDNSRILPTLLLLRDALTEGNTLDAAQLLSSLLGKGRGLTPSGDDLVAGLLLVLNRWQKALGFAGDLSSLNQQVTQSAYGQTTTVSANLIECAASGYSDERLLAVVDCLFTGGPSESDCVSYLLNWGASSGIDTFVGVAIALTC
jgi:hypothetical protein